MSKTSDKDPVRFSSPYEREWTSMLEDRPPVDTPTVDSKPGAKLRIDPRITAKKVSYYIDRINALEIDNKRLDDERLTALADMFDAHQHVGQLQYELAEFQDKPEAFERLRGLLRKEKQMRREQSKRLDEVCNERDGAQAALKSEMNHSAQLTGWKNKAEVKLAAVRYHLEAWNKSESWCSGDVNADVLRDIDEVVNGGKH